MTRRISTSSAGGTPLSSQDAALGCRATSNSPSIVGFLAIGANEIGGGALAAQQADGAHDDALAGAGLAGEHVHAGLERQLQLVDDGEVADAQLAKHGSVMADG